MPAWACLPWSPLGGGWLTGKYKRDEMPTGATRLGENPNRGGESYAPRNALERTWAIIGGRGDRQGAWRQHGAGGARLDGGAAGDHLGHPRRPHARTARRQSRRGMKLKLSDDDMARLNEVSAPQSADYPYGKGGINQRHRKIEGGR
jgi:hypothetical protein